MICFWCLINFAQCNGLKLTHVVEYIRLLFLLWISINILIHYINIPRFFHLNVDRHFGWLISTDSLWELK